VLRNLELGLQNAAELGNDHFTEDKFVLGQHGTQNVSAQPACSECGDQDVRVEADSHDTASNTSSSVRYPRASANGMIWRRACSNCRTANWRRSASRARSLRERPDSRAKRSSCSSRSGSKRIVSAEVFMYYNV